MIAQISVLSDRVSASSITLKAVSVGTEKTVEQKGVPDMIPPEACYLGWQQCLHKLAKLVEPEINE